MRQQHRQPEERRAVQVEGVGVHHSAAKVGRPRKGIARRTGKGAVRVARTLDKAVHIPVKGDLLAVEIAGIVEKAAVKDDRTAEKKMAAVRAHSPTACQNFLWFCSLGVSSRGFINFSIVFLFLRAPARKWI